MAAASGRRYVLTVVGPEGDRAERLLRDRLSRLRTLSDDGTARPADPVPLDDGGFVVLHEEVPGADLAVVRHARGALTAAEAVGVLVPLARSLVRWHAGGLVHGDVAPANVVLTPDGRPVLVDLVHGAGDAERGTPGFAAPERRAGATPGGDVHALGRLGLHLMGARTDRPGRSAPRSGAGRLELLGGAEAGRGAVLDCLARAADPDPARRPSAAELASSLEAACEPALLTLPGEEELARAALRCAAEAEVTERPVRVTGRHRRRRSRRPLLLGLATVAVLAVCATVVVRTAQTAPGGEPTAAGRVVTPVLAAAGGVVTPGDPSRAAADLTRRRATALVAGDLQALAAVTLPGSPAARADEALAARLAGSGEVGGPAREATVEVLDVVQVAGLTVGSAGGAAVTGGVPGEVRVRVTARASARPARLPGMTGAAGTPRADDASTVLLVLRATPGGWRVSEVLPPGP